MGDLLGIISPLKKFMSNSNEEIYVTLKGEKEVVLSLKEGRIYDIPDFQREIRWTSDNVAMLIEDIKSGPKFLGNIILTKHNDLKYSIIDGQQRITVLMMILCCIKKLHKGEIDIIEPCKLEIESFSKFSFLIENEFEKDYITKDVYESDKLKQIEKYIQLWKYILSTREIKERREAKKIIENLGACSFNIILNEADDVSDGIRYFIDVNLKGKQLDVEDIFKSYLFRNDSSIEIRKQWYQLKMFVAEIEESKMDYKLLKLLEHYFLCDLYSNKEYKGMEFGMDFLLKKPYGEFRKGTHLIEIVNSNKYMLKSLERLNKVAKMMLLIVNGNEHVLEKQQFFRCEGSSKEIDNQEAQVIHNIIIKILKDKNVLPKALVMKYLIILNYEKIDNRKECIRTIYGIYLFYVLFSIFENKKSTDVLIHIIKADKSEWYKELVKQINEYFAVDKITDARLLAQYKIAQNEEEEDYRFRCKSLATVYNYFINSNGKVNVRKGKMNELCKFIKDDDKFSVEHFIISQTKNKEIIVDNNKYVIESKIYNKYVNNFFNFIFIDREINSELGNNWLPKKIEILAEKEILCEYSKMIIGKANKLKEEFEIRSGEGYKDKLDLFFAREFRDEYIQYTKSVLNSIIDRISSCN